MHLFLFFNSNSLALDTIVFLFPFTTQIINFLLVMSEESTHALDQA